MHTYIIYMLIYIMFLKGGGCVWEAEKRWACKKFQKNNFLLDEESFWNIPLQIEYSNPN